MRVVHELIKVRNYATATKKLPLSSAQYCLNLIKQYDYENFLTLLLLDKQSRHSAIAIRSFNVEVSRVPEIVSEKTIGLMRMKFWEDTIETCFAGNVRQVPEHPVALELYKVVNSIKLTKRHFKNLVLTRKDSLASQQFANLDELEAYSEKTVSSIYYLVLEASSIRNVNADHAASHLGKSQGILQQLRSLPHAQRLGFIGIPKDILIKNKISEEEIIRTKSSQKLADCVFELATRSHQHLMKSKTLLDLVPKNSRNIFLPLVIVESYLNRLQNVDYNIFHPSLRYRSWKLLPQLWYQYFKGKW